MEPQNDLLSDLHDLQERCASLLDAVERLVDETHR